MLISLWGKITIYIGPISYWVIGVDGNGLIPLSVPEALFKGKPNYKGIVDERCKNGNLEWS